MDINIEEIKKNIDQFKNNKEEFDNIKKNSFVINALNLKNKDYFGIALKRVKLLYDICILLTKEKINKENQKLAKHKMTDDDYVQLIIYNDNDNSDDTLEEKKSVCKFYLKNFKDQNIKLNFDDINKEVNDVGYLQIKQRLSIYFAFQEMNKAFENVETYSSLKNSVEKLQSELEKYKYDRENVYLFSLDKNNITKENIDYLKKYCSILLEQNKEVKVGIDSKMGSQDNGDKANYLYSADELNLVGELDSVLRKYDDNNTVKFNELHKFKNIDDYKKAWTFEQVLKANVFIDFIVRDIKKNKLTPFETILYLHNKFSQLKYKASNNIEEARVIVGVVNNKKIVCSGYSSLLKAVIDRLEDKNLTCDIVGCGFFSKDNKNLGKHTHNLVYINDSQYNIKGYYACDITVDANSRYKPYDFSHCVFPIKDLMNYKDMKYKQKFYDNRKDTLLFDKEDLKGILKSNIMYNLKTKLNTLKMLTTRPEIVDQYGEKSQVIPMETYKMALKNLANKEEDFINKGENKDEFVEKALKFTQIRAKETFEDKAINTFVETKKEEKKDNIDSNSYLYDDRDNM